MKSVWILCGFLILLFPLCSTGAGAPTLQVVIIAISDFDDTQYQNPSLELGIKASEETLTNFFRDQFPNAHVTTIDTKDRTTWGGLSQYFKSAFQDTVSGNVTLLFVLSHGELVPFPNQRFGNDLYIVTSDTDSADPRAKGLSLTRDILGSVTGVADGSILLGFIDTCHSGAANNFGIDTQQINADLAGMKMMFMGASLSDQLAFKASFSSALVHLWEANSSGINSTCTSPEQSPKLVRDQIKKDLTAAKEPLNPNEGYPKVLIHFHGSFCLESLSSERAFVIIQNASDQSILVRFIDKAGKIPTDDEPIDEHDSASLALPKGDYSIQYIAADGSQRKTDVDLSQSSWYYDNYGQTSTASVALAFDKGSERAVIAGFPVAVVNELRTRAFAAYVGSNNTIAANRVLALLPSQEVVQAPDYAVLSPPQFKILVTDAKAAVLAGKFKDGAAQFETAARTPGVDPVTAKFAAADAYLATAASGDSLKATRLRKEFKLSDKELCTNCVALEKQARTSTDVAAKFKSSGIVALLTTAPTTIDPQAMLQQTTDEEVKP